MGGFFAYLKPIFPFMMICLLAYIIDCLTAYLLSRRAHKQYPDKVDGKFRSSYAKRMFHQLLITCSMLVLLFLVDEIIFPFQAMYLANIAAGMYCFVQIWSILENESSCKNAKWARFFQRFMVDKAERHLNVNIRDIFNENEQQK